MKIGVIGGGAWGSALAQIASADGQETLLWALEGEVVEAINARHENPSYLPGVALNPTIRATSNFGDLAGCDAWLVVTRDMRTHEIVAVEFARKGEGQ